MLTQTAIRTDTFRRFVPSARSAPAAIQPLDGASEREPLAHSMQLMGATMSYPRNAEIFGENEPADYVYKVISGSVRTYKILSDGRRQIGGFYLPGDIFGLQFAEEHTFSAEAVTDTKVLVVKRSALTALAGRDAAICSPTPAANCGGYRTASCCWSRALRSGSPVSFWRWPSALRPAISSSCRCRDRTSPIISA